MSFTLKKSENKKSVDYVPLKVIPVLIGFREAFKQSDSLLDLKPACNQFPGLLQDGIRRTVNKRDHSAI